MPDDIELNALQLPGHETRLTEKPYLELLPLVRVLSRVLDPYLSQPFALLGHSMGGLICYELAREIRTRRDVEPSVMFISGLRAPHIPSPDPPLHALEKPEFVRRLELRYGMPLSLSQESELLDTFLPLLRANFRMCETYVYRPEPPFRCPISVFGGLQDPRIGRSDLAAWKEQTSGPLKVRMLEGNHYFFEHSLMEITTFVARDLATYVPFVT